jgi:hypothetical protein
MMAIMISTMARKKWFMMVSSVGLVGDLACRHSASVNAGRLHSWVLSNHAMVRAVSNSISKCETSGKAAVVKENEVLSGHITKLPCRRVAMKSGWNRVQRSFYL